MTEKHLVLFALTRPSRAHELQEPSETIAIKQMLEEKWAKSLGVDLDKLKKSVTGTDTTSTLHTGGSTLVGTETMHNGVVDDCASDQESDGDPDTPTITDDIHNDGGTGGVIDIPL
ncbi:hypothetical protein [Bradyrhizobium sp. HKCCYLRH1030]|uniref:hypothetical protein n=1 Tax=Bradyrhizobium sp. HKCCYLRH1030 TaxID=3420744 RepID=UPI003EBDE955